jgi:1,4-dihydroxy-2-naphthoate octaprenyltransferase
MASTGPSAADWFAGARPRTLPAAISPVLAGTGIAAYADDVVAWKALLALAYAAPGARAARLVGQKARGPALIPVLQLTGIAELLYGLGLVVGLPIGA